MAKTIPLPTKGITPRETELATLSELAEAIKQVFDLGLKLGRDVTVTVGVPIN
jgi:hypothetical protein